MVSRIVAASIKIGVISEEKRPIYEMGFASLFFSLFTWLTFLVMGLLLGRWYEAITYLLFYIPVRIFAGGQHQKTRLKCYIQSVCIFVAVFFAADILVAMQKPTFLLCSLFIFCIILFVLSPVDNAKKRLAQKQRDKYRVITRLLVLVACLVLFILLHSPLENLFVYGYLSLFTISIQVIVGYIQNIKGG